MFLLFDFFRGLCQNGRMSFAKETNATTTLICLLIIAMSAFRYLNQLVDVYANSPFFDFSLYYIYADITSKGINPFDPNIIVKAGGIAQAANYPPLFYALMHPFTLIPFGLASRAWFILNQVFIIIVVILLFKLVKNSFTLVNLSGLIFLIANFFPIYGSNFLGQANVLVLFLLTLSLYTYKNKHIIFTALLIALVTHIKIQYALYLPVFFFVGYRKLFVYTLLFIILGWVLGFIALGFEQNIGYLKYISNFPKELYLWVGNISVIANISRYFGLNMVPLALVVSLIFFVGFIKYIASGKDSFDASYVWSLSTLGTLICSPLLEIHHLAVCFLPIVWLVFSYQKNVFKRNNIFIFALIVLSIFLLGIWVFVSPLPNISGWNSVLPLTTRTFGLLGLFSVLVLIQQTRVKNLG